MAKHLNINFAFKFFLMYDKRVQLMNIYTENFWNDEKKEAGIMFWKYSHHFPNEVGWNSRPEVHDLQLHRLQRPVGGERDVGLAKAALYRHVPKISEKLPRHQRSYLCFVKRKKTLDVCGIRTQNVRIPG